MNTSPAPIPASVADAFLAALAERGVDWVFANAGTDFAPIIETLSTPSELPRPNVIEVLHETVAVAMAHGYAVMTGRAQCAMVHVNVGTANALMGLINASRSRTPILLASGRTPVTEHGRLGSRDLPIHWGQEMFDQGGMLREFVKWDHELKVPEQIVDIVDRALAIATSEPAGPTYLSLPREVLAEPIPAGADLDVTRRGGLPSKPHADPTAIAAAAALLAVAERPVVICSGGDRELFDVLGPFAERHAFPVVQFWRTGVAIATDHPMYAGENPHGLLADADAVLVIDTLVPWLPERASIDRSTPVIQIGPDPLFGDVPMRNFASDLTITSNAAAAVAALSTALDACSDGSRSAQRYAQLAQRLAAERQAVRTKARHTDGTAMGRSFMSTVIDDAVDDSAIIVNELGVVPAAMDFRHYDSFFGSAVSGGLGWGGGAALGIKLAANDRTVVWATGDGSYVFSNPLACHHAAAALGLGLLTVVADNRVWNAVRNSTTSIYPSGRASASSVMPLTSIEPAPDYTKFVEAYGGYGEHVEQPDDLAPALERALGHTRNGRQALLSVRIDPNLP